MATVEVNHGSYLYNNEADNNEGNEVLCESGAGVLNNSAEITIDACDFDTGDAVCYADCVLIQADFNFDYCNYVVDSSACPSSDSGGSSDSSSGNSTDSGDSSISGALTSMSCGKCWIFVSLTFVLNVILVLS